jgi:hypothetical protein
MPASHAILDLDQLDVCAAGWPWAPWFQLALARLRCVAYAT